MKSIFKIGNQITITHQVVEADLASFNEENVHPFYATFALGRDAEWACRQFVLQMKDHDEEGIGTFLNIRHISPAFLDDIVEITATLKVLDGHKIDCDFQAKVGDRIIAEGEQGQKILKKEKVQRLIQSVKNG